MKKSKQKLRFESLAAVQTTHTVHPVTGVGGRSGRVLKRPVALDVGALAGVYHRPLLFWNPWTNPSTASVDDSEAACGAIAEDGSLYLVRLSLAKTLSKPCPECYPGSADVEN